MRLLLASTLIVLVGLAPALTGAEELGRDRLPVFQIDAADGTAISFGGRNDRPTVLLFWATWCPYCRDLFPHIESVRADYAARGVNFYAMNVWEDGDPEAYLAEHGYRMALILGADLIAEDFGVHGTPGVIVADGNRHLLYKRERGEKPEDVERALRHALDSSLADGEQTPARSVGCR